MNREPSQFELEYGYPESDLMNNIVSSNENSGGGRGCIRAFFDGHYKHVKVDKKLAYSLHKYRISYSIKNHEFFSGVVLGTVPLYFKDSDVNTLYRNMLDILPITITKDYGSCPSIPPYKITGDLYNLSLFWLIHKFISSKLPAKVKMDGAIECMLLFNYRTIAALSSNGFRYLADPAAATAAYEKLSNRFILKQTKSWEGYMQYRATNVITTESVHWKNLMTMADDKKFLYAISDSQGRIADTFKQIYRVYVSVLENNDSIVSTSTVDEAFGEKDIVGIYGNDATKIQAVVNASNNPTNFYKVEIADILTQLYPVITKSNLATLLRDYSKNTMGRYSKMINSFTSDALVWVYQYLSTSALAPSEKKRLPIVLSYVRRAISSSRSTDPSLLKLRDDGYVLINRLIKTDKQTTLTYRTVLILYLFMYSIVSE